MTTIADPLAESRRAAERSRNRARAKRKSAKAKSEKFSVLPLANSDAPQTDLNGAPIGEPSAAPIAESIPEMPSEDAATELLITSINRMYEQDLIVGKRASILRHRMGKSLAILRERTPHGEWSKLFADGKDKTAQRFPFTVRTAINFIHLALSYTEQEAADCHATDLYERAVVAGGHVDDTGRVRPLWKFYDELPSAEDIEGLQKGADEILHTFRTIVKKHADRGNLRPQVAKYLNEYGLELANDLTSAADEYRSKAQALETFVREALPVENVNDPAPSDFPILPDTATA